MVFPIDGQDVLTDVWLVDLGGDRYRLAMNQFLESPTTLYWGDEFFATQDQSGDLVLDRIALPQKFAYLQLIASGSLSKGLTEGNALTNKIHELGGGWESIAGGYLTITLPSDQVAEFESWHRATAPNGE